MNGLEDSFGWNHERIVTQQPGHDASEERRDLEDVRYGGRVEQLVLREFKNNEDKNMGG